MFLIFGFTVFLQSVLPTQNSLNIYYLVRIRRAWYSNFSQYWRLILLNAKSSGEAFTLPAMHLSLTVLWRNKGIHKILDKDQLRRKRVRFLGVVSVVAILVPICEFADNTFILFFIASIPKIWTEQLPTPKSKIYLLHTILLFNIFLTGVQYRAVLMKVQQRIWLTNECKPIKKK